MSIFFRKDEDKQKSFIKDKMKKFIGENVVSQKNIIKPEATIKKIAIVVTNLRNYSEICSKLELFDLGSVLNKYYTIAVKNFSKYEINVDLIGNKVVALFGVPFTDINYMKDAFTSSIKIIEDFDNFNSSLTGTNNLPLKVTIGINSGDALVGNFGSNQRLVYTAIGKNVDIAFRNSEIGNDRKIYVSERMFRKEKNYIDEMSIKVNSIINSDDKNKTIKELSI